MALYHVGERFSREVTFDPHTIHAFAAMAGDHNPLHHDAAFAGRSRFGGVIASGAHYGALLMGMVATQLARDPDTTVAGLEFNLKFRKAVHAGQTMTLEWTIETKTPAPTLGGELLHLKGHMIDHAGVVYVTTAATCLVMAAQSIHTGPMPPAQDDNAP